VNRLTFPLSGGPNVEDELPVDAVPHPAIMLIKISKDTHTRKLLKGEKYLF